MKKHTLVLLAVNSIILCFFALNNKYPLLDELSGNYIASTISDQKSNVSELYGWFVIYSSWNTSLWFTVFTQAVLISVLLYYYFRSVCRQINFAVPYLAFGFFATFFMSLSITTSAIDPSVFATITFLSTAILLCNLEIRLPEVIVISVILEVGMLMDFAYLLVVTIIVVTYVPIYLFSISVKRLLCYINPLNLVLCIGLVIAGWCINLFILNPDTKVHHINRPYKTTFFEHLYHIENRRFTTTNEHPKSLLAIEKTFSNELRECMLADQMYKRKDFAFIGISQIIFVIISLCSYLFISKKMQHQDLRYLCLFIVILLLYALVNTVLQRRLDLSGQVIWLIILPLISHLAKNSRLSLTSEINSHE